MEPSGWKPRPNAKPRKARKPVCSSSSWSAYSLSCPSPWSAATVSSSGSCRCCWGHLAPPPDPYPTEPRNMAALLHISSLLVHVRPEMLAAVKANLRQLDGLELHQESPQGKLVVVLETDHERQILTRIEQINALPGVLNAALVYHELLENEGASE